jgi:hypothetical protein
VFCRIPPEHGKRTRELVCVPERIRVILNTSFGNITVRDKAGLQVFLSHSHDEASLAVALQEQIHTDFLGLVQVFVSSNRRDLLPGADWLDCLKNKIDGADVFAVLCSNRSVLQPWVNIELGAAWFRRERPMTIPLCHSDLTEGALESPLDRKQAITVSTPDGVKALYERLAIELGSKVPAVSFESIASKLKNFETEYRENNRLKEQSAHLSPAERESLTEKYIDPAVLCVSSRQFEESAKRDLDLIRGFLPAKLNHKVVVTSDELREELGTKIYDIIHTALYICPLSGDLVFSDIDPESKAHISAQPDTLTALDFGKLTRVARTSLLVVATPEPLSFVARLLPYTNIVFPSGPVEPEALAKWMGAFYKLLAMSSALKDASERASAQHCSCMMLYPRLPSAAGVDGMSTPAGA